MHHKKKTLPAHFQAVREGFKTFEIRDNSDCGYQKGDIVTLREYNPKLVSIENGDIGCFGTLTGASLDVEITYVSNYMQKENYVVFGFKVCDRQDNS